MGDIYHRKGINAKRKGLIKYRAPFIYMLHVVPHAVTIAECVLLCLEGAGLKRLDVFMWEATMAVDKLL